MVSYPREQGEAIFPTMDFPFFFRKGIVLEDGAQVRDLNHSFLQGKLIMEQSPKHLD